MNEENNNVIPPLPDTPSQEDYNNYKYKLTPFKLQVLQNFPYIEADFDAITNYQLLCKVVDYLNQVIDNENTTESIVQTQIDNINSLYNAYVELKDYVDDYFTNLDVQDEINNKLDEMVEDGTMTELFAPYTVSFNAQIEAQNRLIQNVLNNSPHPASSVSDMTNTNYIYVLTDTTSPDYNKWFYYNTTTSEWTVGGVYQAIVLGENSVDTYNLNTQFIDKVINLGYEENATMIRNYNQEYTDTNNHALHYVNTDKAITVGPGTYFFATKVTLSSLSAKVRFRAGLRVGSTDRSPKTGTTNDCSFFVDEANEIKMCYGLTTLSADNESYTIRPYILFVNDTGANPISANITILESYVIKLDANVLADEIIEMNDIHQRIATYSFQKAYPKVHFTENDINKYVLPLIDLSSLVSPLESDIEELQDNTVIVPDYIRTASETYINSFNPPSKSLSLIFQTDHHAQTTGNLYKCAQDSILAGNLLFNNLPISLNILGGDFIANGSSTTKATAKSYMTKILSNLDNVVNNILLRGNHDCNQLNSNDNEIMNDLEIFNIIGKKYITNKINIVTNNNIATPMYGYIDFPFQKIRVVFVNTSDGYDQGIKIGMGNINKTQLQWLADNAFDLTGKEDYQTIVFGHYPIYDFSDETATVEQGRLTALKQLLLAFKNGSNLNYTSGGTNYTVVKDFRSQGAKTLIAYVCGHVHDDKSIQTQGGILQISTTNAGYYNKEEYVGTINDFALDIITIDSINKVLYFDRLGYGSNRTFNYN